MSSRKQNRRTNAKIDALLVNQQLTPCGLAWLKVALDPFHDEEITCDGYPDMDTSRSLVQCTTFTQSITSYEATPTLVWDCHIPFVPVTFNWGQAPLTVSPTQGLLSQFTVAPNGNMTETVANTRAQSLFPGYCAMAVPAGTDLTEAVITASTINFNCSFQAAFSEGNRRLIACGYEVVNTTAELYKQGTVTCYRTPSNLCHASLSDTDDVPFYAQLATLFPTNQSDAQLFPNARTWGAIDGVYSVATLNTINNPFTQNLPGTAGIISMFTEDELIAGDGTLAYFPPQNAPCNRQLPYDCHGAIFAGLSPQTTLQLTVRYYWELIPDVSDPMMLVMAKPSPCVDPLALQLYSRALEHLPVAVPVSENPLGEWFDTVMDVLTTALPVIGSAIPLPYAGTIGSAAGAAAQAAKTYNAAQRKEDAERVKQTVATDITTSSIGTRRANKGKPRKPLPPIPNKNSAAYKKLRADLQSANAILANGGGGRRGRRKR